MCGRFTQHHNSGQVSEHFGVQQTLFEVSPRYNIAPQQTIPVILAPQGITVLDGFRWGLVPSWAKESNIGQKMINARSETLTEKPSFRNALVRRRCVIPADGFYEWERLEGGVRQPVHFRRRDGDLFGFAGLWEEWQDPDAENELLRTCTIVTTSANETVSPVHDRMPVMLTPDAEAIWLNSSVRDTDLLRSLLVSYPDEAMESFRVSRRVNAPVNEGAELLVAE